MIYILLISVKALGILVHPSVLTRSYLIKLLGYEFIYIVIKSRQ